MPSRPSSVGFERKRRLRAVEVGRQHRHAEPHAFGDGGGDPVRRARWVAAGEHEHGRHVLGGVVRLEVRRLVGDRGVADSVRLVEGVAGEGLDEVEDGLGVLVRVALLARAADEPLPLGAHLLGDLLAHRLAHDVGLAERVAGELLGDEQHLVLVDDDAVGLVENLGEVGVRVADRFLAVLRAAERADVLHRAGAIERDHAPRARRSIRGAAPGWRGACPPIRAGTRRTSRPGRACRRWRGRPRASAARSMTSPRCLAMRSTARPRIVRLASPRKSILSSPIWATCSIAYWVVGSASGSSPRAGRWSGTCSTSGSFEMTTPAACVLACRATPSSPCAVSTSRRTSGSSLVRLLQLGALVEGAVEGHVDRRGHEAGDPVGIGVRHAEGATGVAQRRLRAERAERDDLGDAIAAVLFGDVAQYLVATVIGEVHVDVGHLAALEVEEALEDEPVPDRVDIRDVEAVEDDARRGAAAHPHRDAARPGETGEVVDDEEVGAEPRLAHDVELVLEALAHGVIGARVAPMQPFPGELREELVGGEPGRDLGQRQVQPIELELDVAALGDELRVVDGLRELGEQRPHLGFGLHVVRVVGEAHPLRLIDGRVRADAEEHIVQLVLAGVGVVRVVRGDERDAHGARHLDQARVGAIVIRQILVELHLDEVVVAEQLAIPPGDASACRRRDRPARRDGARCSGIRRAR